MSKESQQQILSFKVSKANPCLASWSSLSFTGLAMRMIAALSQSRYAWSKLRNKNFRWESERGRIEDLMGIPFQVENRMIKGTQNMVWGGGGGQNDRFQVNTSKFISLFFKHRQIDRTKRFAVQTPSHSVTWTSSLHVMLCYNMVSYIPVCT